MEDAVMDIMYEIPSDDTIEECIVNEDVVNGLADAEIKYAPSGTKPKTKKKAEKPHWYQGESMSENTFKIPVYTSEGAYQIAGNGQFILTLVEKITKLLLAKCC